MKSFFAIRSKFRVAFILLVMVTIILAAALLERKFFNDVNTSSASIYNDRLIPATAIFHLSDNTYREQTIFEEHGGKPLSNQIIAKLNAIKESNDSIITAFEETYLTPTEETHLNLLKSDLESYYAIRDELLKHGNVNQGLDLEKMAKNFDEIRSDLRSLSHIQIKVGRELLTATEQNVARAHLITNLQIVAAIVLSIICQVLILTSKSIKSPISQRHDLN